MRQGDHIFAVASHFVLFGVFPCSLVEVLSVGGEFGGGGTGMGPHSISQADSGTHMGSEIHGRQMSGLVDHWQGRMDLVEVDMVPATVSQCTQQCLDPEALLQFINDVLVGQSFLQAQANHFPREVVAAAKAIVWYGIQG